MGIWAESATVVHPCAGPHEIPAMRVLKFGVLFSLLPALLPAVAPTSAAVGRSAAATIQDPERPLVAPTRTGALQFGDELQVRGKGLVRNGVGLCEWGIFGIDLYEAAMYTERSVTDLKGALEPAQTLVIHLHFVRALTKAQLTEAYTAAVRANTGDKAAEFEKPLARLVESLQDVKSGDAYTFFCEPGTGLSVLRAGKVVATVADEEFRKLFVKLYLGDKPPTKALRDGLLTGRKV